MAWDGGDGLDLDYNYLNIPAAYPDPSNPLHLFLNQKDPDWHMRQYIDCFSMVEIPHIECYTLRSLYFSTDGANWTNNTNWMLNYSPSSWYGVTVAAGRVTSLELSYNQLNGNLPPDIWNLLNFEELHMVENALTGSIPPLREILPASPGWILLAIN